MGRVERGTGLPAFQRSETSGPFRLRAEGHVIDDATLAQTTPLMRNHLNPFGRYHFDLDRMRQAGPSSSPSQL
jgi:hypothetical protein